MLLDVHQRAEDDIGELAVVEMREIAGRIGERLVHKLVHKLKNVGKEVVRVEILIGDLVELHFSENDNDVGDEREVVR